MTRTVRILGTRGVPAAHGGFETAAENIGLELVRRGWRVVVYCQSPERSAEPRYDVWRGIERVHLAERLPGALGTVWFDALAMRHAARHRDVCLTFGYNTAFLNEALRARNIPTIINMDGVEWKRARWSNAQRHFLHLNERLACRIGDHLIADHPEIERHLRNVAPRARVTTIAYGAPQVRSAAVAPVVQMALEPGQYVMVVARPVAENSILEMVRSFSRRPRGVKLVVLGSYSHSDPYHAAVRAAAGDEVVFPGAVYDQDVLQALRVHSRAYLHGHTVGGTNPSLVEALGCGSPVIAQDNVFNRWVAADAGLYFAGEDEFEVALERLLDDADLAQELSTAAVERHAKAFDWQRITDQYEDLIEAYLPAAQRVSPGISVPRQRAGGSGAPRPRTGSRSAVEKTVDNTAHRSHSVS